MLFENSYSAFCDVFPDGQHFVMLEIDQEASRITHFNVVLNSFEELKPPRPAKVARGVAHGDAAVSPIARRI